MKYLVHVFLLATLLCMTSCNDSDGPINTPLIMAISPNSIWTPDSNSQSRLYTVSFAGGNSNPYWSVTSNQTWCTLSDTGHTGSGTFTATVSASHGIPRSATITVTCSEAIGSPLSVVVNQGTYLMPLEAGGSMVDISFPGSDTVTINRLDSAIVGNPVTIHTILCAPVTFYRSVNNSAWTRGSTYYLFNRSDGLYSFFDTTRSTGIVRSVKYPVSVGDTLLVGTWSTMVCESVTDTVTVPAGTFTNCIRNRVVSSYNNTTSIVWHKPGYGEIRQVFYNTTTGTLDSLKVLYRYH